MTNPRVTYAKLLADVGEKQIKIQIDEATWIITDRYINLSRSADRGKA
jgi:hypothetical protein